MEFKTLADVNSPSPGRLMSLDALRGFDMFWIVGADAVVEALRKLSDARGVQLVADQLEHVEWSGFHFEDLIFPMFVFIVGVSLMFSLSRIVERESRAVATQRVIRRAILLYLLGVFYYGGFATPFAQIRLLGVLQRIALCYLFAGLIFLYCRQAGRWAWCIGLLVGYWLAMTYVPAPGGTAGNFAEGQNLANSIDAKYLPLRKWDGDHDPEGLLSTLPAIANCLIGVLIGTMLRNSNHSNWSKVLCLTAAGISFLALGWAWSYQFPIIKKIWTSSFVLIACGYSSLFLALFFQIIEVWGWRSWAMPLVWIGMNPITIYMLHNVVDVERIAKRLVGGELNESFGRYGSLVIAIAELAITFAVARFLYRRKIFLRV